MGMDAYVVRDSEDADLRSSRNCLLNGENGTIETDVVFTNMLTRLEIDLAYFSEKLMNLDLYMSAVSPENNGLGLDDDIEKALIFDLLFGYLHSEVTELDHFLSVLKEKITDAHQKIHPCSNGVIEESNVIPQKKLHPVRSSWKDLQGKVSKMKQELADLHQTLSAIVPSSLYTLEEGDPLDFGQRRLVLGMLEKSLAAELALKKQLLESKEREEEQKLKLLSMKESVSKMEAFAEIALERLLEAEYSSEMFMRISKELMFKNQISQINLQCYAQKEGELKSELQRSSELLKKKDHALMDVQRKYEKLRQGSPDKETLEDRIRLLETKLRESEFKIREVNDSYEASQEQLSIMEDAIESIREHAFMAESRAHSAETRLTALTEENIELREEVEFLKAGAANEEKMGLLETQVRDMEAQLQTSKATIESHLEQQNMLYAAILDMEILIGELKSKVSKAESRAENAEEQCLALVESNLELTKEMSSLKSKSEKLEESLKEANRAKVAWGKEISNGAKLVTEMVMQLATERERIQKQLSSLERENKILLQELRKMRKNSFKTENGFYRENDIKDMGSSRTSGAPSETEDVIEETPTSSASASNQVDVDQPSESNAVDENEVVCSSTSDDATTFAYPPPSPADVDIDSSGNEGRERRKLVDKKCYVFGAIFVFLVSILAVNSNWEDTLSSMKHL